MTPLPNPRLFRCRDARGAVYDHGAHVVDWTPAGQSPVLWMSAASCFDSQSPIRGGIPICWPWFGAARTPAHGFARLTNWDLVQVDADDTAITARYVLDGETCGFEHHCRLSYDVSFGSRFSATLTVANTDTGPFAFEAALHTYLAVGDARRVVITGLDGASYLDRAPGGAAGSHTQSGDLRISAETDRIYRTTAGIDVIDPVLQRRIRVARTGSADAVVWNPWVDKSRAMADFGDDEWTSMLCVETCNAGDDAVTLSPGQSHAMTCVLTVDPIA